jgi:hypothetical protein
VNWNNHFITRIPVIEWIKERAEEERAEEERTEEEGRKRKGRNRKGRKRKGRWIRKILLVRKGTNE